MADVKKITWSEMIDAFYKHNEEVDIKAKGTDPNPIYGVVVYREDNWNKIYSLEARSYRVSSDNKAFIAGNISNSIFADSLDGSDTGVRLDWCKEWEVDYCYMEDADGTK